MRSVTVTTWVALMEELYLESWDHGIERFRSPFVFRGVCDANSNLSTSLMRLGAGYEELAKLESHMLRNFRKYAHLAAGAQIGNSIWNWLALAQHHGMQTRMLDWTYSPLVGAHFATELPSTFEIDGAIYCINHRVANSLLPKELRQQVEIGGLDVFTAEMLDSAASTLEKLVSLSREPFVVFLEPPSLDARIVNQFALFSLVSSPSRGLDEIIEKHPELGKKIIVPAGLKWEIRDKLDQAGITERVLYPGLDGLSRWLSRYYTPMARRRV